MKILIFILSVIFLPLSLASAATHNVSTAGQLTTAMAAAVAGDEIVLANGSYTGQWTTGNAGSSGNVITVRAATQHGATLSNTQTCSGQSGQVAFTVADNYWTFDGLKFDGVATAISISNNVTNTTITNNIINNFTHNGILAVAGVTNVLIENNAIGYGATCTGSGFDMAGIQFIHSGGTAWTSTATTIRNNAIFATGDNGYQAGSKNGYSVLLANASGITSQGNIIFAAGGKGVFRILGQITNGGVNHVVRDNLFFWGEGGGAGTDDCVDDSNQFLNNIMYGNYYTNFATKGTNTLGNHTIKNNLFWMNAFSRNNAGTTAGGGGSLGAGCLTSALMHTNNTLTDNIFYSPDNTSDSHRLFDMTVGTQANWCATCNYNMYWANNSTVANWFNGTWTAGANDIRSFSSQPLFTSSATGDFSLTGSSPGKAAGSAGGDIGVAYNAYLVKAKTAKLFELEAAAQENTGLTGAISTSFTVSTAHYYQVYFYIPTSPSASCNTSGETQQFTIEGSTTDLLRDVGALHSDTAWTQSAGPARYLTLGRHIATDGTLNISWPTANCVEKVFIRQIPTTTEAYAWLSLTDAARNRVVMVQ